MTFGKLYDLALGMRGVSPQSVHSSVLPVEIGWTNGESVLFASSDASKTVHQYLVVGFGSKFDPSNVHVRIENGSGTPGAASAMADFLRQRGFDVVDTSNAASFGYPTTTIETVGSERSRAKSPRRCRSRIHTSTSRRSMASTSLSSSVAITEFKKRVKARGGSRPRSWALLVLLRASRHWHAPLDPPRAARISTGDRSAADVAAAQVIAPSAATDRAAHAARGTRTRATSTTAAARRSHVRRWTLPRADAAVAGATPGAQGSGRVLPYRSRRNDAAGDHYTRPRSRHRNWQPYEYASRVVDAEHGRAAPR